jgi:hypothetical protein
MFCRLLLLVLMALPSTGCLTTSTTQFATRDSATFTATVFWPPVVSFYESEHDNSMRLVLQTAIVPPSGFLGPPELGTRYVSIPLSDDRSVPTECALPELIGLELDEARRVLDELSEEEAIKIDLMAMQLRERVRAARKPPTGSLIESFPHDSGDRHATVLFVRGRATVLAFHELVLRRPATSSASRPSGPPEPRRSEIFATLVMPRTFETSFADRLVRLSTGIVAVPAAASGDVALIGGVAVLSTGAAAAAPFAWIVKATGIGS